MSHSVPKSLLCPNCRKLINGSAASCPHCGLKHPSSRWKSFFLRTTKTDIDTLLTIVIAINVLMFILSIVIDPRQQSLNFSPFHFLSPSNQSLLVLGSTGTVPLFQLNRWWTLVAAGYLHGGLVHILFNMLALRQLVPLMIREYGINRAIIIYTLGSCGGFWVSGLAGVPFTMGASAAICSLIGALLYYGKSRGGVYGREIFSQLGGWALGIAIFGFMVPGINNWGHGGGMLAGALLGLLLGYNDKARTSSLHRSIALCCMIATALILTWSVANGLLFLLFRE